MSCILLRCKWPFEWWGAGEVIRLERGADLHTAQLMPLPLTISLVSVKSRLDLPFWYRLVRIVLEKMPLNGCVLCKWPFGPAAFNKLESGSTD